MALDVKLKFETKLDKIEAQKMIANTLTLLSQRGLFVTSVKIEEASYQKGENNKNKE